MRNPKLATRYANALFEFASETNDVENVYQDILHIQKVIASHSEMKKVLESPIISQEKKHNIISAVFSKDITETAFNFFSLIVKKRREPELLMICNQFKKIYNHHHNIKEAFITSAQPLSEKMVHFIKTYLEEGSPFTVILHLSVNKNIIGGLVVKIDDFYFDASIQAKVLKLKAEFSQNVYAAGF